MSNLQHRPLRKDIFPAFASFAATFGAGMAFSFFQLTGGFPDARQDRPAFVLDDASDPIALADAALVAQGEERLSPTPEPESAATDVRPLAYQTHKAPPPRVSIDTESIDSILTKHTRELARMPPGRAALPPEGLAGAAEAVQPAAQARSASPPDIVIDILGPPQTGDVD